MARKECMEMKNFKVIAWLANSQVYFINKTIKYCHLQIILYYFKNFIKHFKLKRPLIIGKLAPNSIDLPLLPSEPGGFIRNCRRSPL